ncbi:hypothetical protein [Mesoterricola silvestris]|uniref:Uncharacterized protein n=1 Tax=Mesoterricola silvestris TaxID=2927979 RepID=A0AA48GVZ6_9BACT|nr:hypothetical protein [Mesoterricola silvestris]BDU71353.1 hypothetical protein METEAL_05270 [Mesoterricola silvestris]
MTPRLPAQPNPPPAEPASPGVVKIQKREAKPAVTTREKVCATCGRTFRLSPDEKFFNCPHCYKKTLPARKPARKNEAQILTQITCVECGTQEYVDFVPTDPAAAFCASCFSRRKRELQAQKPHTERR